MSDRSVALRAWLRARPPGGTPVETYLRNFGITGALPQSFRTESALIGPAMLASVTAPDGRLTAVHRMPLTDDGEKRGEGVTLGPLGDGAVRITPLPAHFSFLGIAATIEEALAVASCRTGFPVWSSLNRERLGCIWIPRAVQLVVLLTSANAASERAAEQAEAIWTASGKLTHVEYLNRLASRVA